MKNEIPLWFKVVYVLSIIVAFYFFLPVGVKEKVTFNDKTVEVDRIMYNAVPRELVLETFLGQLTGYGPDCTGCSGKTASGQVVRDGKIYFDDSYYGTIRIVAADSKYAFGTIVRITAPNISAEPITAVVLDTGGKIKGNKMDLLFENEQATKSVGYQKNVKYEILRYGW